MNNEPSAQQDAIFNWFAMGAGHLIVKARAGTGKTTTIIEGVNRAPERRILLAAFNKKIAEELTQRMENPCAEAKTLHGVGYSFVLANWQCKLDGDRPWTLIKKILADDVPDEIRRLVIRLAARCKSTCPFPDSVQDVVEEAQDADLEPDEQFEARDWTTEFVAQKAMELMDLSCMKDGTIDFDDMIFVPLRNKWVRPRYDLTVIDEAQDMSYSQLLLAQKVTKPSGRICVVGDDRQAIYGFRGADSRSMARLKVALNAAELGLTTTYRCPRLVVDIAKLIVSDYTAAPNAPDGIVENTDRRGLVDLAKGGDFVLSRKNAPLATVCLSFLRANKSAKIEGKDIGQTMITLVRKLKGKSIPDFLGRLKKWKEKETARAQKLPESRRDAKLDLISDQAETLEALVDGLSGVRELETRITDLFTDTAQKGSKSFIICSSVHKAKGLERDNVFLLEETFQGKHSEELNIRYVAVTRSKNRLVWVRNEKLDAKKAAETPEA